MSVLTIVMFALAALFAAAMHHFDRVLQRHRATGVPGSAFRWVPLRWLDASKYTEEGQTFRRNLIRCWWLMVLCFAAAAVSTLVRT